MDAIAGRFPEGRPLGRRRGMMLVYGRQRLRGTATLQVADHRCHDRDGHCWPIPWRASAPSAPWNGVSLRPPTAARDRNPTAPLFSAPPAGAHLAATPPDDPPNRPVERRWLYSKNGREGPHPRQAPPLP